MDADGREKVATWVMLVCGVALLGAGRPTAGRSGPWGADYFPNVPLITQDGKVVRLYDDLLKGKSVAINLIYTTCSASCPGSTGESTSSRPDAPPATPSARGMASDQI